MDHLPVWLQWLVSIATILSSIGVIIAFVQLRISSEQFHEQLKISDAQFQAQIKLTQDQLKLTQDQFKLINQGYMKMDMLQRLNSTEITDVSALIPVSATTLYQSSAPVLTLENVGNLPVKMKIIYFKVFFNDVEAPNQTSWEKSKDVVYPKAVVQYNMGEFPFTPDNKGLYLNEISDLKITYKLLIHYHDYNDTDKNPKEKTIDREIKLLSSGVYYNDINDIL